MEFDDRILTQSTRSRESDNQTLGRQTLILSIEGTLDQLTAMEDELTQLPDPLPLFAAELRRGLAEVLGYHDDN